MTREQVRMVRYAKGSRRENQSMVWVWESLFDMFFGGGGSGSVYFFLDR